MAEHDATTGDVVREYIWVDDMPVAMVDQSSGTEHIYFIHTGQTGEPLMMTDSSKAAVWDDYLDPYGTATPLGTDTVSLDLRHPGQWLQPETGNLAQNWFRDYDPSLGRYTETDPLGIEGVDNLYPYADNTPLVLIDSTGKVQNVLEATCIDPAQPVCWTGAAIDAITWIGGAAGLVGLTELVNNLSERCEPKQCERQYEDDSEVCRNLKSKGARARCWQSAAERRAHCIRTKGEVGWPPLFTH